MTNRGGRAVGPSSRHLCSTSVGSNARLGSAARSAGTRGRAESFSTDGLAAKRCGLSASLRMRRSLSSSGGKADADRKVETFADHVHAAIGALQQHHDLGAVGHEAPAAAALHLSTIQSDERLGSVRATTTSRLLAGQGRLSRPAAHPQKDQSRTSAWPRYGGRLVGQVQWATAPIDPRRLVRSQADGAWPRSANPHP
jgi:hypothetical protein